MASNMNDNVNRFCCWREKQEESFFIKHKVKLASQAYFQFECILEKVWKSFFRWIGNEYDSFGSECEVWGFFFVGCDENRINEDRYLQPMSPRAHALFSLCLYHSLNIPQQESSTFNNPYHLISIKQLQILNISHSSLIFH
jgi:hypothetical protein